MEEELKIFFKKEDIFPYIQINNENSLKKIHNLFLKKIIDHDSIDENDDVECYYYGLYYENEYINTSKYELMEKYYKLSISKGNTYAMSNLARYYIENEKQEEYENAKKYLLEAINLDNDYAMYELGCYYRFIEEKYDEMEKYYLMSINKGNVYAMHELGSYYRYKKRNNAKMKKYYLMAIEKGHIWSMTALASYYEYQEKDFNQMEKYYSMAADNGHTDAMRMLQRYYKDNYRYELMKKYCLMEIDTNEEDCKYAMVKLGNHYRIIENNYDEMKKYYLMAINKKCTNAMIELAYYYEYTEKNYDEMKKYYLMAIDIGNLQAMTNLGYYYEYMEKNYDEMKRYYLMAINQGYTTGMYYLGRYYKDKEKNYEEMKKYYLMYIEKIRDSDIINELGEYYSTIEKNYDMARKYYLMGIENGNKDSMKYLLYHYEYVEKDYDMLKKYYSISMGINDIKIFDGFIDYCKKLNVNDYYKERYQSHYDCIEKVVGYYKKTTDNNDYGFIEFYKYIPDKFVYILNNRLSNQIDLPRNSYESFCSLDIVNDNKVNPIVKQKQYILKMTNIFPKNFTYNYIIHFMELLSISRAKNMCFPRDIIMKIAGHLFI